MICDAPTTISSYPSSATPWLPEPEPEETATNYRSKSIALLQTGSDAINRLLAERQRAVTQQELEREKAILAQKY
ncbi:hypothetical protein [Microcoleus sp. PH2017_30_WIL_O_A]|uniref:hypothetical protein n=1 Tax=Microcoleus sp. PH2017_30_WIL_O_A TaxID=2798840 RepID=UPI0025E8C8AF|nr:hypothetical protein [Microcoleus sp. PH2017_30_WIL_O_A]